MAAIPSNRIFLISVDIFHIEDGKDFKHWVVLQKDMPKKKTVTDNAMLMMQ